MEKEKKTMTLGKRVALAIAGILLALILVLVIAVYALWHNELSSLTSLKLLRERNDAHLDGDVYTMNVKGDFYLDEFVAQGGAKNDKGNSQA